MQIFNKAIKPSVSKVIVIGGGIGGLTLANACLDAGIEVELYEKRQLNAMLSGAGGIFIQKNAMRVYKLLRSGKIYERFYEQGGKILKGGFFSKNGTPLYINSPQFAGEEDLGICLSRPLLQQILYEALDDRIVVHSLSPIQFVEDTVSGREKWESRGIGVLLTETAIATDIIIFSEVSRMARSTLQVLEMLECCVRRGINVHIAKQGMVLDGSMQSRITATVLGLAAEIERELIVLRTTEALAKRKAEGKTLGRPKGRQSTHLKLDTREAEIRSYLHRRISSQSIALASTSCKLGKSGF